MEDSMIGDNSLQNVAALEHVKPSSSSSWIKQSDSEFDISIVVPTRNEAGNIRPLLTRIEQATRKLHIEVVFVDDSTDNTPDTIQELQDKFSLQVVLIARPPERRGNGLGGAVVEGLRVARAPWICVMDGDLQHPPELIPQLLESAQRDKLDVVIGSRLAIGADASSLGSKRNLISRVFAMTTRIAFPMRLKNVTDPLSGFFLARRAAVDLNSLHPHGFKILLEILIRCPDLRIAEIPFQFGYRHTGDSKASLQETIRFFRLLLGLRLTTDERFARFLIVGASGLLVNNLALAAFTELSGIHYLLSAILATQVSTLWNFGLAESWVFRQRKSERSFLQRLSSFVLLNNLMLLLRGPLLSFMVEQLGVHYLASNLISLFALTLLRYVVADQWIWGKEIAKQVLPIQNMRRQKLRFRRKAFLASNSSSPQERFLFSYNIHGILQVASMFQLPELEYFRVDHLLKEPDLRLRLERRRKERRRRERDGTQRRSTNNIHYSESLGRFGFQVTISHDNGVEIAVSPILQLSLHVLYTNVIEPILRWAFVRKGYALVHAACIASNGQAILVTAKTDTGKTSTILRAVENFGWSFLSDDMTIVSRDGKVMSYPKPLTISNHTLRAVNRNSSLLLWERLALQIQSRLHSRSGRRIGIKLSETVLPAATMNAIVQMLIPPPKYMVDRLIRQATYANSAMLSSAVIIERGPVHEETLQHDQAVEIFVQNADDAYGFPPYPILATFLSCWNGEDLHPQEQAIVNEALNSIPAFRLCDPQFNWWQRLPNVLTISIPKGGRQFVSAPDGFPTPFVGLP
jgi:dolichol-phosphate mannosyltransferase